MSEKVLITPAELSDMVKSEPIVVIDTRDPATYAAGHLPNAVNIHDIVTYLATSTPEGVAALRDKFAGIFGAAGLSGTETAVVYEQSMNTGFGQSCRGYVLLRYLGYPKVKILHGGYVAWTAAGLPTSTEVPTPAPKSFPIDPNAAGILVDLQSMKAAVADPNIVKLDTRDVDEWIAEFVLALWQGFLPAQGTHPGRGLARMVPDDEAQPEWADVQVARGNPCRMRHRRRHAGDAGRALLLQGRAGVEHPGRPERSRHRERHSLFRLVERMVTRSVPADRDRPAVHDIGRAQRRRLRPAAKQPSAGLQAGTPIAAA